MTTQDFLAMLPLLVIGYAAVILMLVGAFRTKHDTALITALVGLGAGFVSVLIALPYAPRTITSFLRVDAFSLYFTALVIAASFLITLFCRDYLEAHESRTSAFYMLVLFAVLGMATVAMSIHLIAFFLGVEVLSLSLYGLIGYTRDYRESLEGAVKYLVMAAASSAFLLFGIALVYSENGTMSLAALGNESLSLISIFGVALILVVFGFKLALAPFHTWSPDVYQGAPSPVTALIATGSKGAVLAFLLRMMMFGGMSHNRSVLLALAVLSVATMTVGNILALLQGNLKRLLAYSSIAHLGYLLIPLIAGGMLGASSIAFYLVAYFATTIIAFGVISVLSGNKQIEGVEECSLAPCGRSGDPEEHARGLGYVRIARRSDVDDIREYRGLSMTHPMLAAILSLALISLTGIPPTAGFIAKFYIFSAAIRAGLWPLVIIGVLNSGISAFYYLRVVVAMYGSPEPEIEALPSAKPLAALALGISTAALLFFGIYPGPLVRLVEQVMSLTGLR